MIYTECTVTISNDANATVELPIILYRGDREVDIYFTIVNDVYRYNKKSENDNVIDNTKASYAQLVIKRKDAPSIFSEIKPTEDGKALLTITKDMIDELEEKGKYDFQIRLYNETQESRISMPPVIGGIEIKEPIDIEDFENILPVADEAQADVSVIDEESVEDIAQADGSYNKSEWKSGDVITSGRLNKIEEAIDTLYGIRPQLISGGVLNVRLAEIINNLVRLPEIGSRIYAVITTNCGVELSDGSIIKLNDNESVIRQNVEFEFVSVPIGLAKIYTVKMVLTTAKEIMIGSFRLREGHEKAELVDDLIYRLESVDMTGYATKDDIGDINTILDSLNGEEI